MFKRNSDFVPLPLQRKPVLGFVRKESCRFLLACSLIERAKQRVSIYQDRSVSGCAYFKIRYRPCSRRLGTFYLGQLSPAEHLLLTNLITTRWPDAQHATRIKDLTGIRQEYRDTAVEVAARTGFHFLGNRLFRRNSVAVVDQTNLRELRQMMLKIRDIDWQSWALQRTRLPRLSPRRQRRTCATVRRLSRAIRATDSSIQKLERVIERSVCEH